MIRLLVVDDFPAIREIIREYFERLGGGIKVVAEASNGAEALEIAGSVDLDVILMDIRMPVMDGIEATRILKQERKHTAQIITYSSYSPDQIQEKALEVGAAIHMVKPFEFHDLYEAVQKIAAPVAG